MRMYLNIFGYSIIVSLVLIQWSGHQVGGAPLPHQNEISKICLDLEKMVHSKPSENWLGKLSKSNINRKIGEVLRKRNDGETRSLGDGYTDEIIDVKTDNEVAEDGQLFKVSTLATGSSTNFNGFPLFFQQVNNKVTESDLKDFLAFITLGVNVRGEMFGKNENNTNIGLPRNIHESSEKTEACRRMVEALQTQVSDDKGSSIETYRNLKNQKSIDQATQIKSYEGDWPKNSTRVRTRYVIDRGGYAVHSDNLSKGAANSNVASELADIQSQGTYQDSVVKISRLDLTPLGLGRDDFGKH
ncbi:uncharacterized protein LOC141855547 [Brevipalpus obovatus]|uniref:uncharacterized protein LOC141855547 n=1 Tax=Brevipalpus obovatus TaxID=246614 RepID=UPI003D9F174E